MASGLESEAERAAASWEVGPTNDVVLALIETLVDPRLPYRVSVNDPPAIDAQESVAKQMHAVVLLYNYYHRKQKPELEFLDFVSFSKLALSLRLSLTVFMKMANESQSMASNVSEDRLSVTEKAVKDACDITMALNASKDSPVTERWPISKVAVLVIDSKKENCLLRFGAVTEGVWSLIEKELNEFDINQGILDEEKVGTKRKSINRKDSEFLQIAFDAVKDIAAGIDRADLVVLETHVTHSLSKVTSAAQFYMMQYCKPFSTNQIVPLKFLVESLQGPLAEKYDDSWATVTNFVEYHQMLPYVGFISNWLSRKDLCLPSSNDYNALSTTKSGEKELNQSKIAALPRSEYRKNLSTQGPSQNTVTDENLLKSSDTLCRDEKKTAEKGDIYISCHQSELIAAAENPLAPFDPSHDIEILSKHDSEDLKNALALLYRKRQEMCSQMRTMEDELALYEDCIQRIRDGGEVVLARRCIKSIIRGNNDLLPKNETQILDKSRKPGEDWSSPQSEKQTGLSDIYLLGRSSCQDLEYICLKNNWRLPRYFVEPSDGKFLSNVAVGSKNLELSLKGGLECSPCEARESAAAHMIAKLRDAFRVIN